MLTSIHPLGERARHNRWGVTVAAFTVAAVTAGAAAGAVLGWVGGLMPGDSWRWPAVILALTAAGGLDLARVRALGPRRQVNEDWIGRYRGWVYGAGFGAQLGAGSATYVVTWGVWALYVSMLAVGSPLRGALIGALFGLGRSAFPLAAGWIDRPSRLSGFSRRLSRLAVPVTRLSAVAMVALAGAVGVMAVIR